jgi:hypothetical protein
MDGFGPNSHDEENDPEDLGIFHRHPRPTSEDTESGPISTNRGTNGIDRNGCELRIHGNCWRSLHLNEVRKPFCTYCRNVRCGHGDGNPGIYNGGPFAGRPTCVDTVNAGSDRIPFPPDPNAHIIYETHCPACRAVLEGITWHDSGSGIIENALTPAQRRSDDAPPMPSQLGDDNFY